MAPAKALPEESPPVRFTWVLAMVVANTDGTDRRENVWAARLVEMTWRRAQPRTQL